MRLWLGAIVAVTMLAAQASFSLADDEGEEIEQTSVEVTEDQGGGDEEQSDEGEGETESFSASKISDLGSNGDIAPTTAHTASITMTKLLVGDLANTNDKFRFRITRTTGNPSSWQENNITGTGGSLAQTVDPSDGPFTVLEEAQVGSLDDYDVEISCLNATDPFAAVSGSSLQLPALTAGDAIVCTVTNTPRGENGGSEGGTIEVIKHLVNPLHPSHKFDLQIDGVTKKNNAKHEDTTGAIEVDAGTQTVGETAGEADQGEQATILDDYDVEIDCTREGESEPFASDSGQASLDIQVEDGDEIVCVITNTGRSSGDDTNDDPVDTTEVTINKIWIDLDGNEGDEPPGDLPSGFEITLGGNIDATCSYLGIDLDCNVTDIDGLSDGDEVDVDEADMPEGWARSEDPVIASCEEEQNQTDGTDTDCIITVVNVEEAVLGGDTGNGNGDEVLGTVTSRGGARGDSLALTGASLVTMLLFALALMAGGTLSRRLGRRRGDEV